MNAATPMGGRMAVFRTKGVSVPIPSPGFSNLPALLPLPPVWSSSPGHLHAGAGDFKPRTQITRGQVDLARRPPRPKMTAAKECKERKAERRDANLANSCQFSFPTLVSNPSTNDYQLSANHQLPAAPKPGEGESTINFQQSTLN